MVADENRTDAEHDRVRARGQELHEREIGRDETLRGHPRGQVVAAEPAEPTDRRGLLGEGLGFAHAGEALLEIGVGNGDAFAGLVVQRRGPAAEDHGRDGQRMTMLNVHRPSRRLNNTSAMPTPRKVTNETSADSSPFSINDSN